MFRNSCFGLAIMVMALEAQTMSLYRQFTTPWNGAAVAADASGIYLIGNRGFCPFDVVQCRADVSKYDFRDNELWTREFTIPSLARVVLGGAAADGTGLYVDAGDWVNGPFFVRKYSAEGDELWTRQLEARALGMAADASGVYVAGGNTRNYASAYLRKYSPDGAELWTKRFGDSQTRTAVAVDATGVYLTYSNGVAGAVVRKWDALGNELWTRQLSDSPRTIAAAAPTGFYVLAYVPRTGAFLRKYDSAGDEVWSRMLESPPDYYLGSKIAADATGVYLAGTWSIGYAPYTPWIVLPGQCRSGSGGDAFVRKYDPDGAELWTRQFGTSQATGASGVAVDASGVYVVGTVNPDSFRSEWELAPTEILETLEPGSFFLARFEKSPTVVTGSGPRIFPDCVVNAASYLGGGVAPGEMVTLFGSAMGPSELVPLRVTENGTLATNLADTRILFNNVSAPLVHVSEKQSTAIVPYAVAGRSSVDVQVEYKGVRSNVITVPEAARLMGKKGGKRTLQIHGREHFSRASKARKSFKGGWPKGRPRKSRAQRQKGLK